MRSVLTLGRLDSALTAAWCRQLKDDYGAPVEDLDFQREPHAEAFFKRLGAERVDSLDRSAYQSSTLCRDLNDPPPPPPAEGCDLVYDGGTLEHVFHIPNAIATCMSLVKTGGHFMASLPANHWLGHGFYQFSPELFFRVFSPENGFEIVRVFLAENATAAGRLWRILDPAETGVRTLLSSPRELLVLVWARKTAAVQPFLKWPQQSDYTARWAGGQEPADQPAVKRSGLAAAVRSAIGRLIPIPLQARINWRRHLHEAKRGMIELDKLQ